jgi:hypothetical protein
MCAPTRAAPRRHCAEAVVLMPSAVTWASCLVRRYSGRPRMIATWAASWQTGECVVGWMTGQALAQAIVRTYCSRCSCSGSLAALVETMLTYYAWLFDDGVWPAAGREQLFMPRYRST